MEWIKKSLQSEFGKSILVEGRKNISQTNIFFTIFIYKSGSSDGTNLTKLKDEYWVVQLREGENNNLYLCDQWEAVIKLYRDKKIFC